MSKILTMILFISLMMSCAANKKMQTPNETTSENAIPACLQSVINTMASEPNGSPQSVSRYSYKNQTVYYLVSPCCDKYNIVYDSACNILGYPDGGFTGKGDGKMVDFAQEASDKQVVWEKQ
ncbi:MAG: hypothetical protein ABI594_01990 [Ginsengibacter sp.]